MFGFYIKKKLYGAMMMTMVVVYDDDNIQRQGMLSFSQIQCNRLMNKIHVQTMCGFD